MRGQGQPQFAPSAAEIESLARDAMARLPDPFAAHLDGIVLLVEEFADAETLAHFGIEDPFELSGLYHGRPIGEEVATGDLPPKIHFYRRPLLDEWVDSGVALGALITHVLVHEVGHHFGLSDADMHALEEAAG